MASLTRDGSAVAVAVAEVVFLIVFTVSDVEMHGRLNILCGEDADPDPDPDSSHP